MDQNKELKRILYGMGDLLHDGSELFQEYKRERKIYQEILDSMLNLIARNNYHASQILSDHYYNNIQLNLTHRIDQEIENELIIYNYDDTILSLVDYYIISKKYKVNSYNNMLTSMKNSRIGIYRIIDRIEKDASVVIDNILTHQQLMITDKYLGNKDQISLNNYLLLRIIEIDECKFHTGLVININNNINTRNWLKQNKALFSESNQLNALIETYKFFCLNQ